MLIRPLSCAFSALNLVYVVDLAYFNCRYCVLSRFQFSSVSYRCVIVEALFQYFFYYKGCSDWRFDASCLFFYYRLTKYYCLFNQSFSHLVFSLSKSLTNFLSLILSAFRSSNWLLICFQSLMSSKPSPPCTLLSREQTLIYFFSFSIYSSKLFGMFTSFFNDIFQMFNFLMLILINDLLKVLDLFFVEVDNFIGVIQLSSLDIVIASSNRGQLIFNSNFIGLFVKYTVESLIKLLELVPQGIVLLFVSKEQSFSLDIFHKLLLVMPNLFLVVDQMVVNIQGCVIYALVHDYNQIILSNIAQISNYNFNFYMFKNNIMNNEQSQPKKNNKFQTKERILSLKKITTPKKSEILGEKRPLKLQTQTNESNTNMLNSLMQAVQLRDKEICDLQNKLANQKQTSDSLRKKNQILELQIEKHKATENDSGQNRRILQLQTLIQNGKESFKIFEANQKQKNQLLAKDIEIMQEEINSLKQMINVQENQINKLNSQIKKKQIENQNMRGYVVNGENERKKMMEKFNNYKKNIKHSLQFVYRVAQE